MKILLALVFSLTITTVNAGSKRYSLGHNIQPSLPITQIPVAIGTSCATPFHYSTVGLPTSNIPSHCPWPVHNDRWFVFQTPSSRIKLEIETADQGIPINYTLYEESMLQVEGSCGNTPLKEMPLLTPLARYYLRISTPQPTHVDISFCLSSPQEIQVGSNCQNPIIITALPFETWDTTAHFGNHIHGATACITHYTNGNDVVYKYTPNTDQVVDISMDPLGKSWTSIQVLDSCDFTNSNCLGAVANPSLNVRIVKGVPLTAHQSYFIYISSWYPPQRFRYHLEVQQR